MLKEGNEWYDLINNLKIFTVWAASSLIDAVFLALWVFTQWFVNENVIKIFTLNDLDRWMLETFQIIFAIATLAPIIVYVYVDIRVMLLRAQRKIRQEIELSKVNDPDDEYQRKTAS